MKTSNKILSVYILLFLAGLIFLFSNASSVFHAKQIDTESIIRRLDLDAFSVVVVEADVLCTFVFCDTTRIEWPEPIDSVSNEVPAWVQNDTLFIHSIASDRPMEYSVLCPSIQSLIAASNSRVRLRKMHGGHLSIRAVDAQIFLEHYEICSLDSIEKTLSVTLDASQDARVDVRIPMRSMKAQLSDQAHLMAYFGRPIDSLDLKLTKKSEAYIQETPRQINLRRDASTSVTFRR